MKKLNTILVSILVIIFFSIGISRTYATSTTNSERSNNFLKSLTVEGYTITPEFNKYTLTYYLVIPSDVTSINVSAEPENENAKTKITGNTKLSSKENTIKIVVTAQNKTTKTYNIIATKQEDNGLKLNELTIDGATFTEPLSSMNFHYTADLKSDKELTDLKINAVPSMENAEVEIVGSTGLEAGENLVTIILRSGNTVTTYEITVNITVEKTVITEVKNNAIMGTFNKVKDSVTEFFKDENKTIAVLVAVALVLLILVVMLIVKINRKNKVEKNKENLRKRAK